MLSSEHFKNILNYVAIGKKIKKINYGLGVEETMNKKPF